MTRCRPIAALLLGLLLGTSPRASGEGMPVTGTVLDDEGRPLEGVEVTLHPVSTAAERGARHARGEAFPEPEDRAVTRRDGRFRLEAGEAGFWTVAARAEDRVPMEHVLGPLLAPEELEPVELLPDAGLRVLVTDGEGEPVAGAVVEAKGDGPADPGYRRPGLWRPPSHRLGASDAEGRLRLPRFRGEEVVVWAGAPGRSARLEAGEPPGDRPVRVVLAPGPTRRLLVVTPGGAPAAGAVVWVSGPVPAGLTGDDGVVEVPLALDGSEGAVEVQVDSPDGLVAETELRPLREGEEDAPVRVRLEPPPTVSGRVIEAETGDGRAGAVVWLRLDPAAAVRADRTGSFRLPVRRPWREEAVMAAAPGFLQAGSRLPGGGPGAGEEVLLSLEPAATLEGVVVDARGDPVPGAEVRVLRMGARGRGWSGFRAFARAGRDGRFRVAGLAVDQAHAVYASHEGYSPAAEEVPPAPVDPRAGGARGPRRMPDVRVVLQEARALRGRVVSQEGAPVAGARVVILPDEPALRFWPGGAPGRAEATTGADGTFLVAGVLAGPAGLLVSAPGFAPLRRDGVEVPAGGGVTDLGELVLEPEAFVAGRVVDPGGEGVAGASIRAWSEAEAMLGRPVYPGRERDEPVTTGEDGGFRVGGLVPGEPVTLTVRKEGWVTASQRSIRPPPAEPISVVLRPAASLVGTVVDETGRPVPEARVRPSWRGRSLGTGFGRPEAGETDDQGAFELTGLSPGSVSVEAEASGYQVSAPLTVELAPGERREGVKIVLREGVELTGRVLGPDGAPVAGARVATRTEQGMSFFVGSASKETGVDGSFTLDTLSPGRIVLEVTKEGFAVTRKEIDLEPGGGSVEIHLDRGAEVSGWVLEADGSVGAGREIQLAGGNRFAGPNGRATTAADGSFSFRGVSDGEYRVQVFEDGFPVWASPDPVRVEGGASVTGLEVRLSPTATLRGRLVGLDPGEVPAVAVEARLVEEDRYAIRSGEVLEDGGYRISGLTPGRWAVTGNAPRSGRQAHAWAEIGAGQAEAGVDLEFASGHAVSGTVLSGGEPVAGAQVVLAGMEGGRGGATTDADGRFRVEGLPAGHYMLLVQDPLSGTMETRQVEVDGERELRLELESYRVRGVAYAADGSGPVSGASVQLHRVPAGDGPAPTMPRGAATGQDGTFLVTGIGPGRWRLRVEQPGYAAHTSELEVAGGDVEAAPVYLEPTGRLEVVARFADGRVPSAVTALVLDSGGRLVSRRQVTPVGPGRFVLDTVPPGSWTLVLSTREGPTARVEVEAPGVAEVVFPEPCTLVVSVPELEADGSSGFVAVTDPAGTSPWLGGAYALGQSVLAGGRAELRNLPPGTWKVTVNTPDGRSWTATASVVPGPPTEVVLE